MQKETVEQTKITGEPRNSGIGESYLRFWGECLELRSKEVGAVYATWKSAHNSDSARTNSLRTLARNPSEPKAAMLKFLQVELALESFKWQGKIRGQTEQVTFEAELLRDLAIHIYVKHQKARNFLWKYLRTMFRGFGLSDHAIDKWLYHRMDQLKDRIEANLLGEPARRTR